jgi:phosphoserine phosphatase
MLPTRRPGASIGPRAIAHILAGIVAVACGTSHAAQVDPLASWNDGQTKAAVVAFVKAVTDRRSPDYVAPAERIAVFDNDGTLWAEQPMYFQFAFMLGEAKAAAPAHPEWRGQPAYEALITGDREALAQIGQKPVLEFLSNANSHMTVGAYDRIIRYWLDTARHPTLKRRYTELVYVPMQELLAYLRANGFKTFIVSGGGVEFMRPWTMEAYGIPPEQVVGSISDVTLEEQAGAPVLVRQSRIAFIDDGPGKPVGIYRAIGRRPIAAFGNSDGDLQMLQFTAAGPGRRLALIVHHDDADREFAYDRRSSVGRLDKAWNEAIAKHWIVVSMKTDWKQVFAFQQQSTAAR